MTLKEIMEKCSTLVIDEKRILPNYENVEEILYGKEYGKAGK